MAILQAVPGVEVTIVVDGQPLPEHIDDNESQPGPTESVTYVETNAPSAFRIRYTIEDHATRGHDAIVARVSIDGKHVFSTTFTRNPSKLPQTKSHGSFLRTKAGKTYRMGFKFSRLETTEEVGDLTKEEMLEKYKGLGEITIHFYFGERHARNERGPERAKKPTRPKARGDREAETNESQLPEKALKGRAISQDVSFEAREVEHDPPEDRPPSRYTRRAHAFASFTFRYRTLGDLQKSGICEYQPDNAPPPLAHPAMEEKSQREFLTMQDNILRIKREREEESRGASERDGKKPRKDGDQVEVLDLTTD